MMKPRADVLNMISHINPLSTSPVTILLILYGRDTMRNMEDSVETARDLDRRC